MSYFILPYWAYVLLGFGVIAVIVIAVFLGSILWAYVCSVLRSWSVKGK